MTTKTTSKKKDVQQYYIKQQQIQEQYCYKPYRTLRNYLQ